MPMNYSRHRKRYRINKIAVKDCDDYGYIYDFELNLLLCYTYES